MWRYSLTIQLNKNEHAINEGTNYFSLTLSLEFRAELKIITLFQFALILLTFQLRLLQHF